MALTITANNKEISLNQDGYLINLQDWNKEVAEIIAKDEGLELTTQHWQAIECLRHFYINHQLIPPMRAFIKALTKEFGADHFNSIVLHQLFPGGPIKQSARIAGLPKPKKCM